MKRVILLSLLLLCWFTGFAQSEFLITSKEEIEIIKKRINVEPYRSEYLRLLKEADLLVSNPLSDHYKGPEKKQDGTSLGVDIKVIKWSLPEPNTKGVRILYASFIYQLTKDVKYYNAARKALEAQYTEPLMDFTNRKRWADNEVYDINPGFMVAEWLNRMVICADLLEWNDDRFKSWAIEGARYFQRNIDDGFLKNIYITQANREKSIVVDKAKFSIIDKTGALSGNKIPRIALFYNNRKAAMVRCFGSIGVKYNDEDLKKSARLFYQEYFKFSVFSNGFIGEEERANAGNPIGYMISTIDQMKQIADVFARKGDLSLYSYKTSEGLGGTEGKEKDLKLTFTTLAKVIDRSYAINSSYTDALNKSGFHSVFAQANIFFKSDYLKSIYNKTYPSSMASFGPTHIFSSSGGLIPSTVLMYFDMEACSPFERKPVAVDVTTDVLKKIDNLIVAGSKIKNELNNKLDSVGAEIAKLRAEVQGYKVTKTQ